LTHFAEKISRKGSMGFFSFKLSHLIFSLFIWISVNLPLDLPGS
jgi:hypothetical protein